MWGVWEEREEVIEKTPLSSLSSLSLSQQITFLTEQYWDTQTLPAHSNQLLTSMPK